MSIVKNKSILYAVILGEHKGKKCVVRTVGGLDSKSIGVVFSDDPTGMIVSVRKQELVQLETPGWFDPHRAHHSYGLRDYPQMKGTGMNMLRTPDFSQPRALEMDDVLATREVLTAPPRMGYNSSALIRLDESGWVELSPSLPIALRGNQYFKLPIELVRGDELVTGDIVAKNPISTKMNWTAIFLDRKDCQIDVPSCIPLALQ